MKVPVRSLTQISWLMTVVASSILSILLFTYIGFTNEVVFTVVQSTINSLAISFFHIVVLIKIGKYGSRLSPGQQRLYRYVITFIGTLLYGFCVSPVRHVFENSSWRVITFEQRMITIVVGSLALNILILIMHNLVITYHAKNDAEVENAELKAANAEANNLLLKQQIHPHFLFNALNIVKALYKRDVSAGDAYMVHLADFLRAAISNNSAKVVSLGEEIKLCNDYIAMQKIRFGEALQYRMDIDAGTYSNCFMPSFSLQPLLENAIKHNEVTDEQPLVIRVYTAEGSVVVENNLQRKKQPGPSTGNGLVNLMKRYQLLSGEDLVIAEDGAVFSVKLKMLKA